MHTLPTRILTLALSAFLIGAAHAQSITSVERVSLAPSTKEQGDSYSFDSRISGDGQLVTFTSTADNFAAPGNVVGERHEHVYLHDRSNGQTTQLDVTSAGQSGSPSSSFNPNIRVFRSGMQPRISRDRSTLVFMSTSSNISPDGAGETFGSWVYLKDLTDGSIRRIPQAIGDDTSRAETPAYLAINGDGSVVIILAIIANISDDSSSVWELTRYDRESNTTTIIDTGVTGNKFNPAISDDGRYVVFENQVGDFSGPRYSYLYDFESQVLTPLNQGQAAQYPEISGDGATIVFGDASGDTLTLRLHDRATGEEQPLVLGTDGSAPNGISDFPALSQDGRFVAFLSTASNLVVGDDNNLDDIFVLDRQRSTITLVSVQSTCPDVATNEQFNTGPPAISSDGQTLTFAVLERLTAGDRRTKAGALIEPADTNSFDDVYVVTIDYDAAPKKFRTTLKPTAPLVSVNCLGTQARIQFASVEAGTQATASKKKPSVRRVATEVEISRMQGRRVVTRQRMISRRDEITTKQMRPGTYQVRTRARATYTNGKVATSKYSAAEPFIVTGQ